MTTKTNSGALQVQFNAAERAVSDDFNRVQQLASLTHVDLLRRLYTSTATSQAGGGDTSPASALASPLRAIVFEGLRVRPEIGTVNLFVEAGVGLFVSPEALPDPSDSPARLIADPGVQSAAQLTLTAGSGSTRIDVVECSCTTVVTESDSRDVFDPSTGTFTPVLVDKVKRGALAYRIRTGTAGAGFPGTASGWLPLAVCSVPSAATTWDDVTVWDVRPLLADLASPPHRTVGEFPARRRQHAVAVDDGLGAWTAWGIVDGELSGWKAGGNLAPTLSGVSSLRLDSGGANQEPGLSLSGTKPWYLYLAQPFSLPRWCKLSPSTAGARTPQEPRGIPIFTQKPPAGMLGSPALVNQLTLPTATGLGNTTVNAFLALSGAVSAGTFIGCTVGDTTDTSGLIFTPSSGNNTASPIYTLTASTAYPPCVTRIRVLLTTTITDAPGLVAALDRLVFLSDPITAANYSGARLSGTATMPSGGSFIDRFEVELEVPPNLPGGAAQTLSLNVVYTTAFGTFSSQSCDVLGWKLL